MGASFAAAVPSLHMFGGAMIFCWRFLTVLLTRSFILNSHRAVVA